MGYFEGYETININKKELKVYPIYMKDQKIYELLQKLLYQPKNKVYKTKEVLKSTYLNFMLYLMPYDNKESYDRYFQVINDFTELLCYSLKIKKENIIIHNKDLNNNFYSSNKIEIFINGYNVQINDTNFDQLRKLLLEINGLSLKSIEEYDLQLEEALIEHQKIVSGNSKIDNEDIFFSLCVSLKKTPVEMKEKLTFYEYKRLCSIAFKYENFNMIKPLEISGTIQPKIKGKKLVEEWIFHEEDKGRYADILISASKYKANVLDKFAQ